MATVSLQAGANILFQLQAGEQVTVNGQTIPNVLAPYKFSASVLNGTGVGKSQRIGFYQGNLPGIADPIAQPTCVPSGSGGTIAAGTYTFGITWKTAQGDTNISPASATVTTSGSTSSVAVTGPTALPANATGMNVYLLSGGGGTGLVATGGSNVVTVTTLTTSTAVPAVSTATLPLDLDLTALPSPIVGASANANFSVVHSLGFDINDPTSGQIVTVGAAPSNAFDATGGVASWISSGASVTLSGGAPSGRAIHDALGFTVNGTHKILRFLGKFNVGITGAGPLLTFACVGEGT